MLTKRFTCGRGLIKIFEMASKYTAFRCPEDLLEKAKARAKRDRRSLSNYLITLIDRDVSGAANNGPETLGFSTRNPQGED